MSDLRLPADRLSRARAAPRRSRHQLADPRPRRSRANHRAAPLRTLPAAPGAHRHVRAVRHHRHARRRPRRPRTLSAPPAGRALAHHERLETAPRRLVLRQPRRGPGSESPTWARPTARTIRSIHPGVAPHSCRPLGSPRSRQPPSSAERPHRCTGCLRSRLGAAPFVRAACVSTAGRPPSTSALCRWAHVPAGEVDLVLIPPLLAAATSRGIGRDRLGISPGDLVAGRARDYGCEAPPAQPQLHRGVLAPPPG